MDGEYRNPSSPSRLTVPWAGAVVTRKVSGSPSGSLAANASTMLCSIATTISPASAIGGSLTPASEMDTNAVSDAVPSDTRTRNASSPAKSACGV
jgi:hypothetical protein